MAEHNVWVRCPGCGDDVVIKAETVDDWEQCALCEANLTVTEP